MVTIACFVCAIQILEVFIEFLKILYIHDEVCGVIKFKD